MIDWVQTHSVFSAVTLDNGKMGKGRGVTPAPSRKPEKQNSLQTSHSHPYSLQRLRRIAFPKPPLFLFRYAVHLLLFSSCHPCSILPGAVIRAAVILRWHFGESVAAVRVSLAATAREQRQRNRCEAIGRLSERSMPNCLRTFFFCPSFFFPLPIQHMIKAHGQLRFISTETGRAGPQKMWGPIHFKLSLSLFSSVSLSLSLSLTLSLSQKFPINCTICHTVLNTRGPETWSSELTGSNWWKGFIDSLDIVTFVLVRHAKLFVFFVCFYHDVGWWKPNNKK